VRTGDHEQFMFLFCERAHGESAIPVKRAHQCVYPVFLDELGGNFDGLIGIRGIVGLQNRHRPSQHTASLIEEIDGDVGPMNVVN
jgi:hypothetical protein